MPKNAEILFLGSGGDTLVVGKQLLASGGIVLTLEGNQFVIDPGPGAVVQAARYNVDLRATIALFISHNHLNHTGGVNAVVSAMTYGGLDKRGVLVANKTAYNGSETFDPFLNNYYKGHFEKSMAIEQGQRVGINEVEIVATPTMHDDPHGVGFIFKTKDISVAYTSDTGLFPELAKKFRGVKVLILNVKNTEEVKEPGNLNVLDAIELVSQVKPKLAIITHFGIKMLKSDPLITARRISKETGVPCVAAKDGLLVNPKTFSTQLVRSKP